MYDFLVPLYGPEHFNIVKETRKEPGSLPVTENIPLKTEKEKLSELKQEGYGNLDNSQKEVDDKSSTNEVESEAKIKKLGSIYDAMKKAKVQTSELQFKPKKQKGMGVKKNSKNKFHLV